MKTKLTLSIDSEILSKAKKGAKRENIALSKLIESYFKKRYLSSESGETPIADSLRGILKGKVPDLPYKELRDQMYKDKYGI